LNDNSVTAHEYFSERVLEDLRRCKGWERGEVKVKRLLRDGVSKRVNGI
jgi:hypothetical protein